MTKTEADGVFQGARVRYAGRAAIVGAVKTTGMYPPYFTLTYDDDGPSGGEDWKSYQVVGLRDEA